MHSPEIVLKTRREFWGGAAVIFLMTGGAYWGVLDNGFIWDDDARVYQNPTLQSLEGLRQIWFDLKATKQYYPLTFSSFWIEHQLWGFEPRGFHIVNVLLHSTSAVVLWRLLVFLGIPGAWAAGAIFALHPVHVESVAWVSERKNVLSAVFYLASARVYLGWALADAKIDRRYFVALLLFLAALFSKTVTSTLPAALVLVLWWKKGRIELRDFSKLSPFFGLGIGLGLLTAWLEKNVVGAVGFDWSYTLLERGLLAGRVIWFYLGKLLWPEPLVFFYRHWEIDAGIGWQYLFPVSLLLIVACLWLLRERIGRGPLVCALLFGGTLFPALGFFDFYPMRFSFVADHFQYLASVGPIVFFAALGASGVRRLGPRGTSVACVFLIFILVAYAGLVGRRVPDFYDEETLWRDTVEKNPSAYLAHYNLGNLVRLRGKIDEALHHYERAIEANPRYERPYNNIGSIYAKKGRTEEAIAIYRRALAYHPYYLPVHRNLGLLFVKRGEPEQAVFHYRVVLGIRPNDQVIHQRLATALTLLNLPDEALPHYEAARRLRRKNEKTAKTERARGRQGK